MEERTTGTTWRAKGAVDDSALDILSSCSFVCFAVKEGGGARSEGFPTAWQDAWAARSRQGGIAERAPKI